MDFCVFAISRLKGCNFFSLLDFLYITNLIEKMRKRETKNNKKGNNSGNNCAPRDIVIDQHHHHHQYLW
jgi:hypothetical protein